VWLPAAALLYAVALTRSRGVIPALGLLLFLTFRRRLGRTLSLSLGVLGGLAAILFGFTGGRTLSVDESAEGRLEAWAAGLQMLKSSPIWGVGHGAFLDHHPLVAHNSFVHCFAETGLVGYFLWLALLVLTLGGLKRLQESAPATEEGREARRWAHAIQLSLTGFLAGAFFLSRSYGVMLFLLLGLGTAVIDISRREEWGEPGPSPLEWIPAVAALSVLSVLGFWLLMKVLL
jgi:O-antigen ligase